MKSDANNSTHKTTDVAYVKNLIKELKQQSEMANILVKIALKSYRSSIKVLDMTSRLRIASLNVFIKTEKNNSDINVFAPVSHEFMNLVKSYENLTIEFGIISTEFISKLVSYVKNIRKYRIFTLSCCYVAIKMFDNNVKNEEIEQALIHFLQSKAHRYTLNKIIAKKLISYTESQKKIKNKLHLDLTDIRQIYFKLQNIDKSLSNLSNIGEYAAHLAKIEAARLQNREDLIAAFDEIHSLLNQSLIELESMRASFSKTSGVIKALQWNL